ncbi:unnamed protein product [Pylaiella littoralis]
MMGCSGFCRQFGALVRKNALTKRRSKLQLAVELLVPALIILLIGAIKTALNPTKLPGAVPSTDTPVPTYEALQSTGGSPNVLCYDNNMFRRCGCHRSEDDYEVPESYLTGLDITSTGAAMWATLHDVSTLVVFCSAAAGSLVGKTTSTAGSDECTGAKFVRLVCADLAEAINVNLDSFLEIDDACGAGTLASLDLTYEEYLTTIEDAIALLHEEIDLSIPEEDIETYCESLTFAVMPSNDGGAAVESAAQEFFAYIEATFPNTSDHWVSYGSESRLIDVIDASDYSQDQTDNRPAFSAGIVFTSANPDWAYTIRANITKVGYEAASYYMFNVPETRAATENNCKSPTNCPGDDEGRDVFPWTSLYHQSPALMLQQLTDSWIMQTERPTAAVAPVVRITEFPNSSYEEDGFWAQVGGTFAILVVIAVLYPVSNVISALVKEKELRIKEGLKMMGLTDAAHTASWTFHFVCLFFFTSVLMVIASPGIFENSNPVLVFLYFFLFFLASTAFCFFVSSFFSRAKTASTIGTMLFFVALFPYFALTSDATPASSRRAGCLLPPTCLALGTLAFAEFEDSGEGVTPDTAGESEAGFTFNDVITMLFLDIIIYSSLAWYAGNVLPSEWGTAKKPYFFLTKSYWCPGSAAKSALSDNMKVLERDESEGRDSVEPVEDEVRAQVAAGKCVAIRGLTKEYKNSTGGSKLAVDKLDLTMYSGQITALLGHNGAGKTTTIGMLTGMIPVTSGSAFVAGRDVNTDMVNIRNSLGVCPQHDILYPDLTVREHLRMYAVLKAVPSSDLKHAITATLNDVGLTEKENELTKTLSGGQKRKLSVGIALIGGSNVVFLDEPTSGMDPHSRRFTWDLIRKNREGRVIVLTTHFMDEADLLGDRVAIMADGALRCCGSSIFLKNHYGVGYNLTVVRDIQGADMSPAFESGMASDEKTDEPNSSGLNNTATQEGSVKPIKAMVRSHVKEATLLSNVGAEVSFQLPNDASSSFQAMLTEIDDRRAELGINSYGLSVTTLEEVFLRVANGTADVAARKEIASITLQRQNSQSSTMMEAATFKQTGMANTSSKTEDLGIDRSKSLFGRHMMALLMKRLLTFKRDKKMWAFVVLMPALFVLIGILILLAVASTDEPSRLLTPTSYNDGSAPFPFTAECTATASAGTCDADAVVERMDFSEEVVDIASLDVVEDPGGVEQMSVVLQAGGFDKNVYGAVTFREADTASGDFDYTVHSNYSAVHGVPLYVNQINTAILRLVTGDDTLSIALTMHPFPRTQSEKDLGSGFDSFNVSLFILIAFSFVPAAWMAFIVREKETKAKHQQVVSGVGLEAYWLSSYLWDFVSIIPPVAFTLIVLAAADVTALIEGENGVATFLLFLLFSISMPCYTYLWSFAFRNYSTAQNAFLFHNWIVGLILPIATTIMSFFEGVVGDVGMGLASVLRIVPQFALGDGLMSISFMEVFGLIDNKTYTALSMRIAGNSLVYMAVCSVIYLVLLLLLERASAGGSVLSGFCGKLSVGKSLSKLTPRQLGDEDEIDEDVKAEADRVAGGGADHDVVKVKGLRKVYPVSNGAKVAVKSTSLGIPRGECFGLLGINGAGKSSTLAILSGELPPTTGSAFLSGFDVGKNPEEIHRLVGYCPQFDALFETLTGREHLALYASIKGIPASKQSAAVEQKIEEMGLRQYADRPAGGYSGGNKRKLSVAMAMIGDPQIVFLDEPSTGMDPMARRFMWNVIMRIVTENKECAMILTTHSMEECEALCQRIGIMVGGRLRCLGTSQHLKTRFGRGFQLEARVKAIPHEETDAMMATLAQATNGQGTLGKDAGMLRAALSAAQAPELEQEVTPTGRGSSIYHAIESSGGAPVRDLAAWICLEKKCSRVIAFMQQHFAGAAMREKQNAKMRFEFPQQDNLTLAETFGFIEAEREALSIGEYSLSQTSLEQVFNGFAAQQEEELGHAAGTV